MTTIHNLEQEYGVNQILESFLRNGYLPSRKAGPRSSTNAMNILFQGIRHGVVDNLGRKHKIILIPELISEVKKPYLWLCKAFPVPTCRLKVNPYM